MKSLKTKKLNRVLTLVLTFMALMAGQTAWGTESQPVTFKGYYQTSGNTSNYAWTISGPLGQFSSQTQSGTSKTFSNQRINLEGANSVTIDGTFNFANSSTPTNIATGSQVTLAFYSSHYWFYGATVKTLSDANVSGYTYSVSDDKHTITVTIPTGRTFGNVYLEFVPNEPISNSNTTISVPAGDYWVSDASHRPQPVPTVTYRNSIILTRGTDYTLSWTNNSSAGTGTVTVTGTGKYAGTATANFTIRWATYTVVFNKNHNDATGTMANQSFTYGKSQKLTANAFTRTGYTFVNWTSNADGSGTSYTDQQATPNVTTDDGATVTLYAQWTANTYNVTLDNQDATTAGTASVTATYNAVMPAIEVPTRTGYTFGGYYTAPNGGGTQYYDADGASEITWNNTQAITLYAKWTAHHYTVHYDANGGQGSMNDQAFTYDAAQSLTANAFTAPTDYVFKGWNTEADGSGTSYADQLATPNVTPEDGATVTLYAQWRQVAGSCGTNARWSYDDNGTLSITGTGSTDNYNLDESDRPWEQYKDAITTVNIGDGITVIGDLAFYRCTNLATVTGGKDLTNAARNVFSFTQWWNTHSDNDIVNYIGRMAYLCGSRVSGDVTITNGTIAIADDAFHGNQTITSVTIPASVTSIGGFAFYYCKGLTTVNVLAATPPNLGINAFIFNSPSDFSRTFNVRSADYKTNSKWAGIYTHNGDYNGFNNFQMRVVSTLALPDGVTASVADDNKVTILGTTYYAEGVEITLSASGMIITGATYNDGSDHDATNNGNGTWSFTMPATDVTVSASLSSIVSVLWGEGNDGSKEHPYTITTTDGLDLLAAQVNNGNNFEGKFFRLGNDITYSHKADNEEGADTENNYTAIGTSETSFCGTFDGQGKKVSGIRIYKGEVWYQGLFGMAAGATIKNVSLADARITGRQCVGGIVGLLDGTVENCRVGSNVTIHAVTNGAIMHGGVVGLVYDGNISGCVSAATLTVANNLTGTNSYGGIVGVLTGNMSDCLALGASVPNVTGQGAIIGNFASRGTKRPSSTNNYHHGCTVDGNAAPNNNRNVSAYTISAGTNVTVAPAGDADATYLHDGIQRYGDALYYNGVLYAPKDANVSLTLGNTAPAESFLGYAATAGTLTGTENPYTLTMPAGDVTINAKLKVPYIDENGKEKWCGDYTLITSSDEEFSNYGTDGQTNWYVVSGDVTINGQLCLKNSHSHLIVCDGASLTVSSSHEAIYGQNGGLTIYGQAQGGGTITANGYSSGILAYNNITINGCTVSATGSDGIDASGDITINRGYVTATGNTDGIFGNNVTINGGNVRATGGSESNRAGIYAYNTITLSWTSPTDRIYAGSYAIHDGEGGDIKVKSGQIFKDEDSDACYYGTLDSDQISAIADKTLQPYLGTYLPNGTAILLDDDSAYPAGSKNADRIEQLANDGPHLDIMLLGRTLYCDGDWNTLCLPFYIDVDFANSSNPLYGATIMYFEGDYWYDAEGEVSDSYADGLHRSGEIDADGSLHLYFYSNNKIYAGYPYIVKWGTKDSHPTTDIVNPVFQQVTVYDTNLYPSTTEEGPGNVTFRGTYSPINYESDNHSILFLGAKNTLYWPKEGAHIGAFRAYFKLGNGITVGEEASTVRSFNLGFGEDNETTGIISTTDRTDYTDKADAWYSLDGRKLDGKPNAKGMYIYKGRKVVIK